MILPQISFVFENLPKMLLNNPEKMAKWTKNVEKEVKGELGYVTALWEFEDVDNQVPCILLNVKETDIENVICLMHNLFGAKQVW